MSADNHVNNTGDSNHFTKPGVVAQLVVFVASQAAVPRLILISSRIFFVENNSPFLLIQEEVVASYWRNHGKLPPEICQGIVWLGN